MYKQDEIKYLKAKGKVDRLRGFYVHLIVYCIVNTCISTYKVLKGLEYGESFEEAVLDTGTFILWGFWGIGLALHAFAIFGLPMILGKNWEEKKLIEFMEEEEFSQRN